MIVSGGEFGSGPASLDRSGVVSGFTDPPFESVPYYAVFDVHGPGTSYQAVDFGVPTFIIYYGGGNQIAPEPEVSFPGPQTLDALTVDIANSGTVLGVPQPVFDVCTPGVGQTVDFALPGSGVVTRGLQAGAPVDTDGLVYSWDFGDGTPATPLSSSDAIVHAFAATGTFDVRLTVVDHGGVGIIDAGVSPVAAQVVIGASPGAHGACGQVPGGQSSNGGHGATRPGSQAGGAGGTHSTGGGQGAPNTLASGAAQGSAKQLTSSVAPRTSGTPAPVPSGSPGVSTSRGGGGGGSAGAGGGRSAGPGASRSATGTGGRGARTARTVASGRTTSRVSARGAGAGRTTPPKTPAARGVVAGPGLTGVVVDSAGSPLSAGLSSVSSRSLSLLQSLARASTRGGSASASGGLPAWMLGILC